MNGNQRLFLSPPHMSGHELKFVNAAFDSNWIAPAGPDIEAFENELCKYTGAANAVALSSGSAAIHLALQVSGVKPGDDVYCSSFTFAGSAFPITYLQANPVFIDSEKCSWNMDPNLLRDALKERTRIGKKPGAVIVVHLYGQSANIIEIKSICKEFDTLLIEDAAESIGAFFDTKMTGTIGNYGIYSFNGNKIITTSGGGMLVGQEKEKIEKARFLSTQARDPNPFYQHTSIGYNYRMSNVLAAIGRGQLTVLENRVDKRRENYDYYKKSLSELDCVTIIPRDVYGRGNCWLTCIVLDSKKSNITPEDLRISLEKENIESRPLWKPMHLQPIFSGYEAFVSGCSEQLFNSGLCLPSGTAISAADLERVVSIIKKLLLKQIR
jgi:pyridoxal phosphate-dependent aminotransferase EpsN